MRHCLSTAPQAELCEYATDVVLNRPWADEEAGPDLGVRQPVAEQLQDLRLPLGDRCGALGPG